MTLQDLFDELLVSRSVTVHIDKSQSESLRVALSKKWSKYKRLMDSCGFLEEDLAACSLCRTGPDSETGAYTFSLAVSSRPVTQYIVLTADQTADQHTS
jgi:hypothetical protein